VAAALVHRPDGTGRGGRRISSGFALATWRVAPELRAPFSSPLFHSYIVARSWPAINALGLSLPESDQIHAE